MEEEVAPRVVLQHSRRVGLNAQNFLIHTKKILTHKDVEPFNQIISLKFK